jgi:cyclase
MSLTVRIIPCLDVADGRVVKGTKFQDLRDAGDPVALAQRYEREGADELTLLDVSATPAGRTHGLQVVRAVLALPLTVGGGVRTLEDARALLQAGADKVAVNTAAAARPELLTELARAFGCQCTVLALDAARRMDGAGYELVTHSGRTRTGRDALAWAREAAALGAGEIVLTSFDRDGTGLGYDLDLIRQVSAAVDVPVVASGGARSAADMLAALRAGAQAVLAAGIFHRDEVGIGQLKNELAAAGVPIRALEVMS